MSFLGLSGLAALARLTPLQARQWLTEQLYLQRKTERVGAVGDPGGLAPRLADGARGRSRRSARSTRATWIGRGRRPHVGGHHHARPGGAGAPPGAAVRSRSTGAEAYRVDGDHDAVVAEADRFVPTLLRAAHSVVERAAANPRSHRLTRRMAHDGEWPFRRWPAASSGVTQA